MSAPRIAFSWNGLPQYAARLLRAAIAAAGEPCVVVGSHPSVPVEGMERALGQPIFWVDADCAYQWSDLGIAPPKLFIQSGWSYPAFSALGNEARAAGAKIIGLSDANWRGDFRQLALAPIGFRLLHRGRFDAFITPGQQGARFLKYIGMPANRIRTGMYGADPDLFPLGPPLTERPKTILFVGQFIPRKGVVGLAEAFLAMRPQHPDWTLRICGSGPLADAIPRDPAIIIEPFVQPEHLSSRFLQARFLALPSLVEAWGLVVHEAALSGCGLLLSSAIGSADDLATTRNAILHRPGDRDELVRALASAMTTDYAWLSAAHAESRRLAEAFGPKHFAQEFMSLKRTLMDEPELDKSVA